MTAAAVGRPGKLIILSAPSGAGKTTLCKKLLDEMKHRLVLSISCTTRSPRTGESDGVHYHFLTVDQFKAKIDSGDFAEWAQVHGNYYGTSKSIVDSTLAQGKSVLLDIDVQGAASLRTSYEARCYSIFLAPPSMEELRNRLEKRGTDSAEVIQKRLKNAEVEMARATEFHKVIVNDNFDRAYQELKAEVLDHG